MLGMIFMKCGFERTSQLVKEQIMLLLTSQQWSLKAVKQNEANCVFSSVLGY